MIVGTQILVTLGGALLLLRSAGAQCLMSSNGVHSYGDMCQFRCRCQDNFQCSQSDGECPVGCAHGWMGPGCQYVNAAFDKPTNQSSTYPPESLLNKYNSFAAVDGNNETCIKTYSLQEPWWSVDLGEVNYIVGLVLLAKEGDLDSLTVAVSSGNIYNVSTHTVCYQRTGEIAGSDPVLEIMCTQPVWGRYLMIYRPESETGLQLCEVQIYGGRELAFRKTATQSSMLRHNTGAKEANDGSSADDDVSQCSSTQVSDEPWWTVDLGQIYSIQRVVIHNRESTETQEWLRGFWMWITKQPGVYGDSAYLYINQATTTSRTVEVILNQPFDGQYVEILLPAKGRQLSICEVEVFGECPDNKCGTDCSVPCWCNATITGSTKQSAVCPYGCSDRSLVQSQNCELGCDSEHWGQDCKMMCGHCANELPCNIQTGECQDMCATGFKTPPMCSDGCVNGLYGESCDQPCGQCLGDVTCDQVTGFCRSGCEAGYEYPLCKEECTEKTWGVNCSRSCGSCAGGAKCNATTGQCPGNCETGFREPPYCNGGCVEGYYGEDCEQCGKCYGDIHCDVQSGHCDKCSLGYKPPLCKSMCDMGRFGSSCVESCGHCKDGEQCDVTSGMCPSGCETGWISDNCTVVDPEVSKVAASSSEETFKQRKIMGIVLGTVGGVLLISLIIFAYLNWIHRRSRSENIQHEKKGDIIDQNKNSHGYDETATKC